MACTTLPLSLSHQLFLSIKATGTLDQDEKPLEDENPGNQAVRQFFNWLRDEFPKGVILVAHTAFAYDARILIQMMEQSGVKETQTKKVIHGFSDTSVAFKKNFKGNYSGDLNNEHLNKGNI